MQRRGQRADGLAGIECPIPHIARVHSVPGDDIRIVGGECCEVPRGDGGERGRDEVEAEAKGPRGHGECHELWHTVPVKTGATAPDSPSEIGPFTVFAWLWAAGIISHMSSYSEPVELVTVAMFALAIAVVFGIVQDAARFSCCWPYT